ncbi:hypothetical protein PEPS_42990 (plasmid) [Persicobacter psychrovividus]|uniref:Secretion system C-terminal sorting domain-containing protein n=1 Tax=Persicobacter psychrovividus TaxID=387638 RepID=A0ABM7VLY8_9BACT|nr:hypothetical protein PEPS_42990 [Persicobacter psychrovividus]
MFAVNAQDLKHKVVDNKGYEGKTMFGYQGWFAAPEDESVRATWWHWGRNFHSTEIENRTVDMLPDMREFPKNERMSTGYVSKDGKPIEVFSSGKRETVKRHMKWLRDYDIDGVFLQRFISENGDAGVMRFRDEVTKSVKEGSADYGRVFSIMYDGVAGKSTDIIADWKHLVDDLGVTEGDNYLHQDGLPLVALWGYTVRDDAPASELEEVMDFFANAPEEKYRASVMLGVNDNWFKKTEFMPSLKKASVISAWTPGRYRDQDGFDSYLWNQLRPSLNFCQEHDILYVPVAFPGFSWVNLKNNDPNHPLNAIPRLGGDFFWMQLKGYAEKNVQSLYLAMFDEVDESTCYFKTLEKQSELPDVGEWLAMDQDGYDLPSDYYLKLAGRARKIIAGEAEITDEISGLEEAIMTLRIIDDAKVELIFPDYANSKEFEVSVDGGQTFAYKINSAEKRYMIDDLGCGTFNVVVKNSAGELVPMGNVSLESEKPASPMPASNSVNVATDQVFSWVQCPEKNVKLTKVYLSKTKDFADAELQSFDGDQSTVRFDDLIDLQAYFWKVEIILETGQKLNSDVWSFSTKGDMEVAPATDPLPAIGETEISLKPELQWTAGVGNAEEYRVLISESELLDKSDIIAESLTDERLLIDEHLTHNTNYFWRVDQKVGGKWYFGELWRFNTTATPLGIENKKLVAFPNPTNGVFWINISGVDSIIVMNASGAVQPQVLVSGQQVDLSALADGIYFIKVVTGNHIQLLKVLKTQ